MNLPSRNTYVECVPITQWSKCWSGKSASGCWVRFPLEICIFPMVCYSTETKRKEKIVLSRIFSFSSCILIHPFRSEIFRVDTNCMINMSIDELYESCHNPFTRGNQIQTSQYLLQYLNDA